MTAFVKEKFTWDGMYLMYEGLYDGQPTMDEVHPDCHPSWVGEPKPAFIARFKYGRKPYKSWINFLVKKSSVEGYLKLAEEHSPLEAMDLLGFKRK
ncbi:MAG: hypothetical protein CBB67_005820 [Alteromonadaceae bacterium TMED7]|uniref:hypothetical protein n=1 Tax=Alteromonas sp. TaxID=232 RepID=UPI000B635FA5|nr:hypothetical protein [Alteromonas sp.]MAI37791.1 hypothetical protein [Alteromonas sp.]RPH20481.1 MAG: hypothetical protein CBB67_005820 [Alteromonadaceae bacterium TMED7]|tara:strand:+ start:3009 stop:3296 length:288 start_codon:yes stop_codon:yes gene_type:complete